MSTQVMSRMQRLTQIARVPSHLGVRIPEISAPLGGTTKNELAACTITHDLGHWDGHHILRKRQWNHRGRNSP